MASKISLPNGCTMSTPSVSPKNWKTGGATLIQLDWRIQYYFYPPDHGKRKLIVVKGMNDIKNLSARKDVTEELIEDEIETNKNGYNPILKKHVREVDTDV